jgi:hypothetical protein
MAGLGRKVWAADEILAAQDLQDYIQDQVVFVFDSAGARTSGILSPTEGMVSYLKNTNLLYIFDGSTWVEVAPDVGTPGTYTKVTTDFKGRVTSGTTLAAADIPSLDTSKITSGTLADARLANVGSAGTYTKVTTDAKGRVSSGTTLAAADIPSLDAAKISGGTLDNITAFTTTSTGTVNAHIINIRNSGGSNTAQIAGATGAAAFNGNLSAGGTLNVTSSAAFGSTMYGAAVYNQTNTGRAMFVAADGLFGIGASSIRFKENVIDADIDTEKVLDIRVRKFNYRKEFDDDETKDIGVIAEELEALGLTDFIYYDADGIPDGVAYEKLALLLIPVVKGQAVRLDALEARLDRLEK